MVLVYKNLQNWAILDKGKCWDSYSSAMVRIWDTKTYLEIYVNVYAKFTSQAFLVTTQWRFLVVSWFLSSIYSPNHLINPTVSVLMN